MMTFVEFKKERRFEMSFTLTAIRGTKFHELKPVSIPCLSTNKKRLSVQPRNHVCQRSLSKNKNLVERNYPLTCLVKLSRV